MVEAPPVQWAHHSVIVDLSASGQVGTQMRADRVGDQRPTARGPSDSQVLTEHRQRHEGAPGELVDYRHGEPAHRKRRPVKRQPDHLGYPSSSSGSPSPASKSSGLPDTTGTRASAATIGLGNSLTPETFPSRNRQRAM